MTHLLTHGAQDGGCRYTVGLQSCTMCLYGNRGVSRMDKYIVEIDGENLFLDASGSKLALSVKADNGYAVFCTEFPLTPYTEPDLEQVRCAAYEEGRNSLLIEVQKAGKNTIKLEEDEYYQRGLEDAWEAARKICLNECDGGMTPTEVNKIFGVGFYRDALLESASEAIEKIRQYEQEKEEIKIGDEVRNIQYGWTAVVSAIDRECMTLMDTNGKLGDGYDMNRFIKTGRCFPEISEVLKKMREE